MTLRPSLRAERRHRARSATGVVERRAAAASMSRYSVGGTARRGDMLRDDMPCSLAQRGAFAAKPERAFSFGA